MLLIVSLKFVLSLSCLVFLIEERVWVANVLVGEANEVAKSHGTPTRLVRRRILRKTPETPEKLKQVSSMSECMIALMHQHMSQAMHEVPRRGAGRPTGSFNANTAELVEALDKATDDSHALVVQG